MRGSTGPESRRALHDALVAEIEGLAARIRELTEQIEAPGGAGRPDHQCEGTSAGSVASGAVTTGG